MKILGQNEIAVLCVFGEITSGCMPVIRGRDLWLLRKHRRCGARPKNDGYKRQRAFHDFPYDPGQRLSPTRLGDGTLT
jgi:hypothetical protein